MKGNLKKALAMVLSLTVVGSCMVMPVMAEETTPLYNGASSIKVGGEEYVPCLYNANYEQEADADTNATADKYYELQKASNGCVFEKAQPANNATNGLAFKYNATSMTTNPSTADLSYNIPIRDNSDNNKTEYKKEVAISFDVLRESEVRTPAYVLYINNNALRIGSAYINANGDLVVVHHAASTAPIYDETEDVTVCDTNLGLNTWNNITAVFNKDTGKISWYVDGVIQCTVDASKINSSAAEDMKYERYDSWHFGIKNLCVFYPTGSTQDDINSVYIDNVKAGYNVKEKDVPEFGSEYYEYAIKTGAEVKDATCPIGALGGTKNYMISFDVSCPYIAGLSQLFSFYNNENSKIAFGMYPANNEGRLVITNYGIGTAKYSGFFPTASKMLSLGGAAELNVTNPDHKLDSSHLNSFFYTATNAMIKKNEPFNLTYYVDVVNKNVKVYFDGFYVGESASVDTLDMSLKTLYILPYDKNTAGASKPALTFTKYKIGYAKIDEKADIEASDLSIVDGDGIELVNSNTYDADTPVYAKASLKNNTSEALSCVVALAQYEGTKMIGVGLYTVALPANETVGLSEAVDTASLELSEDVSSVKAFVIKGFSDLVPLCDNISYSVSAE